MLGTTDLMNQHDVEGLRRSVAMLSTDSRPFNRSEALTLLEALQGLLRAERIGSELPDPPSH